MKRRAKGRGSDERPRGAEKREQQDVLEEKDLDFHPDELREFLEADLLDVRADPDFKERLRRKLWELVRHRYGSSGDKH